MTPHESRKDVARQRWSDYMPPKATLEECYRIVRMDWVIEHSDWYRESLTAALREARKRRAIQ